MSNNPAVRALRLPPANFDGIKIPRTRQPAREWVRVHQARHPARCQAIKFKSSCNGKACVALFQRDGLETRLGARLLGALSDNDTAVDWLDGHKVILY